MNPKVIVRDGRIWVNLLDGHGLTEVCNATRTGEELLDLAFRFRFRASQTASLLGEPTAESAKWARRAHLTRAAYVAVAS